MISHSLQAWATALGVERRTLEVRIVKAGFRVPKKTGTLSAARVFHSMLGEADVEKRRLAAAQATKIERENAAAAGELVAMVEVEKLLTELVVLPLRQALLAAPTTLDTLCNPADPEMARRAIQQWVDEVLQHCREQLPKPGRSSK